jgi:hypothetical protein
MISSTLRLSLPLALLRRRNDFMGLTISSHGTGLARPGARTKSAVAGRRPVPGQSRLAVGDAEQMVAERTFLGVGDGGLPYQELIKPAFTRRELSPDV